MEKNFNIQRFPKKYFVIFYLKCEIAQFQFYFDLKYK